MIRKNRVRYNNFTVPYFNKLNGEIYSRNRGNNVVCYPEVELEEVVFVVQL